MPTAKQNKMFTPRELKMYIRRLQREVRGLQSRVQRLEEIHDKPRITIIDPIYDFPRNT